MCYKQNRHIRLDNNTLKKTPVKSGRYTLTKARNLVERLIKEQNAVLAFAFNENVLFTNNLAETDIRPAKVKQKISIVFVPKQVLKFMPASKDFNPLHSKTTEMSFPNYVLLFTVIILLLGNPGK